MVAISGWGKEEMMKYHVQAFTVMKICQVLCALFEDAKQMEPQIRLTQVPPCVNKLLYYYMRNFCNLIGLEQ